MNEQSEKRMAGDYTIIQSLHIGDREVVMGERQNAPKDEQYMCAFCQSDGIIALHTQVIVSDDYSEIVELFGKGRKRNAGAGRRTDRHVLNCPQKMTD